MKRRAGRARWRLSGQLLLGGLLLPVVDGVGVLAAEPSLAPLQSLIRQGAQVSVLALRLRDGARLASLNPDRRLIPASLSKLVLAAAALERWGSEHSFETRLWTVGQRAGTVLQGDLVVAGSGDPTLTNEKLWFLCTDVARLGIARVQGDLVLNTALFGAVAPPDQDRLAATTFSSHAYDGGLSAVAVNYSVLGAVVGPGAAVGQPAVVALEPYPLDRVMIVNGVTTTAKGGNGLAASRRRDGQRDVVTVTGQLPVRSSPVRLYRSVSDPEAYAGAVIKAFLAQAGVTVQGQVRVQREPLPVQAVPLAAVEGYPLDWQLRQLFKVSNNFIADMLTIQLDLTDGKQQGATLAGGVARLEAYLQQVLRDSPWPAEQPDGEPVLASGSGLTPASRLSARDVVAVLGRLYRNVREFPSFVAALPIAGGEGTLRQRFNDPATRHLQTRLRAKTGTLTEPREAVGLAGYSRLQDGEWVAFAMLVNGAAERPPFGVERIREAIDTALGRVFPAEP